MSWCLFLDESGHDHSSMPYEVRGGVALQAGRIWPFVQSMQHLELSSYGALLHQFRTEVKGAKLLDRDRFRWASQGPGMSDEERRKNCRIFLTKGLEKKAPQRQEFTAYGQASLAMAQGIFQLLRIHDARIFAAVIPRRSARPEGYAMEEYLRKDHVFLLERFYYFLESQQEHGLLIMDEVEKASDRRFVRRLQSYFTRTHTGQYRSQWIVPSPFFVASDMACPVQAADLVIYCINWGFRLPMRGMNLPVRSEIADRLGPWLGQLQFRGEGEREGRKYSTYGIVYVPDPYGPKAQNEKEATLSGPPESSP